MRLETAFLLDWRVHVRRKSNGKLGIFNASDERQLGVLARRLCEYEILPKTKLDALYAILVRYGCTLPYEAVPPVVDKTPYGNRATVREAIQVDGKLFLCWQVKSMATAKSEFRHVFKNMQGQEVSDVDGLMYTWCLNTAHNVRLLNGARWHVESDIDLRPELGPVPEGLDHRLFGYQVDGVRMLLAGYRILGDEQGLGKTAQTLQFIKVSGYRNVLICCPATLKLNWAKEAVMWGVAGSLDDVTILSGMNPHTVHGGVTIINYDIMSAWVSRLQKIKWDIMVADECQYVQNEESGRGAAFMKLATKCGDRPVFISGTPWTSRPMQLYPALHVSDPAMFPSKVNYGLRFCGPTVGYGGGLEFKGASDLEALHELMSGGILIRRLKADVLKQLPPKRRAVVPMPLEAEGPEAKALMDDIAKLGDGSLGAWGKLKQYAYLRKRKSCIDWIRNYLDSGNKLVVFAVHKRVIDELCEEFGSVAVKLYGDTSDKKRNEAVTRFQTDPSVRLFVGNVQAAGVGITLTAASDTCTVEFDDTASRHLQAEDRVHRIGQKADSVMAYYLVAQGTLDMTLMSIVNRKASNHEKVMDGLGDTAMLSYDRYRPMVEAFSENL